MKVEVGSLFIALTLALPANAEAVTTGRAEVVDGYTLTIDGQTEQIRLSGIDAPDRKQTCLDEAGERYPCGLRSAEHLASLIGPNGVVACSEKGRDLYERVVAECSATRSDTVLNAAMVKAGWAVDDRELGNDRYGAEEAEAKTDRRGLWAGEFVIPSNWRRGERLPGDGNRPGVDTSLTTATTRPPAPRKDGCLIKGDINGYDRVYHLPGQRSYAETKVNEIMGERWFCSEREAIDAGWRAARN